MDLIQTEMMDIVKKHLPAQAAGTLREYLDEAQKDKQRIEEQKRAIAVLTKSLEDEKKVNNEHISKVSELRSKETLLNEKEIKLNQRESEVVKREIKMDIKDEQIKHSDEKVGLMKEICSMLLRNPTYVSRVTEDIPVVRKCFSQEYDSSGNHRTVQNGEYVENQPKVTTTETVQK